VFKGDVTIPDPVCLYDLKAGPWGSDVGSATRTARKPDKARRFKPKELERGRIQRRVGDSRMRKKERRKWPLGDVYIVLPSPADQDGLSVLLSVVLASLEAVAGRPPRCVCMYTPNTPLNQISGCDLARPCRL
jgi:hypothetical protein